ncbi:zinc finger CCCH domain-containing protein 48 [Punica granatum]|uniref:Zinc finger CCCH domain-containing protein 48 n=2 Tax=Punica granatum TaxID=22663 RepID=A0A6P8CI43_PUNGR|nr:zinc finger CCCH domain-containing protein 48 [Punica granatum]XP_031382860.1 zinc finger CCCH domain-containing protein 48 [Punica granatum]XP_031382861.1 zinc finger CCCH domain-containing protein 48 [Punica granatum]
MDVDGNKRVFQRLGAPSSAPNDSSKQKVCYHWRAGKCSRYPCPYLHRELPAPTSNGGGPKRFAEDSGSQFSRRGPNKFTGGSNTWGRVHGGNNTVRKAEKVCNFWVQGHCNFGDRCRYLHSWSVGDSFSLLSQLEGHQKVVTGIAFPSGSDKLYTGGKDESVRMWDCQSGQCILVVNLGAEVGCMISEGPWIFVGLPNLVKAWNTQTSAELSLNGPVGQVYAMVVGHSLLFAGTQDGSILAWKYNEITNNFEPAASLTGHSVAVVSLVVGANRVYSGSMDNTIRVWNLETLQCIQVLSDHTSVVMSVLCWDQFLLSCSLDKTIKVWAATESGNLEVTYTHNEEHGILFLCGMHDLAGRPVLLCACNDNSVRVYDLPSFSERGKIFAKQEVRAIQAGPGGIFFTGDGTGQVKVWKWAESSGQQ